VVWLCGYNDGTGALTWVIATSGGADASTTDIEPKYLPQSCRDQ
jgi:hypothetical protein